MYLCSVVTLGKGKFFFLRIDLYNLGLLIRIKRHSYTQFMLYLCPVGDLALAALTILLMTSCCLSGRLHINSSILQFWSVLYLS